MKFSYNWLTEYLKKAPSPQKMAELLNMHAFEVESVQKLNNDFVLDIKVLPNRAHDCLSHLGIAKELSAISGIGFVLPKFKIKEDKSLKIRDLISVEVIAKDLCPRYSMMAITGVKVGSSPKWMQERLISCGLRPINNIVDITNYVMLETGQPLHAFDLDKIGGQKIIVRRAKKDEKIITLDEAKPERILNQDVLVIADEKKAIGIAGIKGGKETAITQQTKRVVVEAANFDPINIRRSSKALNLKTDASIRFENGIDPNLTEVALQRCLFLIKKLAGGQIISGLIDVYPKKIRPWKIYLDLSKVESLLGVKINQAQIITIFKKLGLQTKKRRKGFLIVEVPTIRRDLLLQEDLIEEIARLYGYEKIPAKMPTGVLLAAGKDESLLYEDKIKDIMVGLGYSEVSGYSLISEQDQKIFNFKNLIGPENPLTQDQKYLRPTLIVGLIKNIKENLKYFDQVRIFEIGKVYQQELRIKNQESRIKNQESRILERKMVAGALSSSQQLENSQQLFYELKGVIDLLLNKLGISDIWYDDYITADQTRICSADQTRICTADQTRIFHPFRRAEIKIGNDLIGWLGEINPEILTSLEIKVPVVVFEIDFETLVKLAQEEMIYQPPSRYPAVVRDLAVLVEPMTKVEEVLNVIETVGGKLVIDVDLFDIYEGEGIPENKKNLAFHIIYQSNERTLTSTEVNRLQEKIIKALEEKGWEVRR